MFLDKYDFDSVQGYLGELVKRIYKESGLGITCVISDEDSQGVVSSDGAEAPVHLTTALIRTIPDHITDKEIFEIIKRARAITPNKDVEFKHKITEFI